MTGRSTHVIEVWGDFACFSRPELKVERWSYPCPTPSAARGIFDAIYAKPHCTDPTKSEFRWQVTKIEILSMPTYIALRRNEVKDRMELGTETEPLKYIDSWIRGDSWPEPIWADADREAAGTDVKGRTQRQTMAIREPRYRLHACILPWPGFERRQTAFDEQFHRRASHGKCFHQPALGCREFVAFFRVVDDLRQAQRDKPPVSLDQEVGFMVYDIFDQSAPQTCTSPPFITLFHARICGGVLAVPDFCSNAVCKPEERAG